MVDADPQADPPWSVSAYDDIDSESCEVDRTVRTGYAAVLYSVPPNVIGGGGCLTPQQFAEAVTPKMNAQ